MKDFNRVFEQLAYRHQYMTVFDDFLTLTICAFGMQRYEEEYLKTLENYNEKEKHLFPQLLGALVQYYTEGSIKSSWVDGLGEFFEEHSGKFDRSARGQFFTPTHICDLLAEITQPKGSSVNDCAAGSGRCLIAADRLDPNNRFQNFYTAQDIDHRCVKMCVINMVLYGMKGVVIHMDSICMNIYGGYRVYMPETGLGVIKLTPEECNYYLFEQVEKTTPKKAEPKPLQHQHTPEQLELLKILTA